MKGHWYISQKFYKKIIRRNHATLFKNNTSWYHPKTENQAYTQIRVEEIYKTNPHASERQCRTDPAYLYIFSSKNFKPLVVIRLTGSMEDYLQGTFVGGAFWLSCPNLLGSYPPIRLQYY